MTLLFNATTIPSADVRRTKRTEFSVSVFGDCVSGALLDREIDNMIASGDPLDRKLFRYIPYNTELTREGLAAFGCGDIEPTSVQKLDKKIGEAVAAQRVKGEHFNFGVFKPS